MLAALQAIFDAKISDYIEIFLTSKSKEKPRPGSGGTGVGASIFGTATQPSTRAESSRLRSVSATT
jgi:hypothetical protein